MTDPLLSILIVNWNTRERVLECLASLPIDVRTSSCEVIVVDNGSVDGSAEALSRQPGHHAHPQRAQCRIRGSGQSGVSTLERRVCPASELRRRTHTGRAQLSHAVPRRSSGRGRSRPPVREPGRLAAALSFPLSDLRDDAGERKRRSCARVMPGSARRLREYRMLDEDFSQPRPVPQPSASCLLLRRSFLPDDHIFDERYPIFFNDVQLARSFADRGLTLWVTPSAQVVHDAHSSVRMLGAAGKRQYLGSVDSHAHRDGVGGQGMALPRDCLHPEHSDLLPRSFGCTRFHGPLEGACGRRRTASLRSDPQPMKRTALMLRTVADRPLSWNRSIATKGSGAPC